MFCPYFIISSIFVLYRASLVYYNIDDNFIFYSYLYWSFWYVPFIMVMFAISPIFINFIELNKRKKILIFMLSIVVSVIVGRRCFNPFLSAVFLVQFLHIWYNDSYCV